MQYLYHWSFNQFFLWIIFYYSNYLVDHLGTGYNFIILIHLGSSMAAACFLAFCFLLYTSMGDNSIVAVAVRNLRPDYLYLDNCGKCNDLRSSHYGSSSQSDLRPGRRQLWQLVSFERATWCRPLLPRSRLKKKKNSWSKSTMRILYNWHSPEVIISN